MTHAFPAAKRLSLALAILLLAPLALLAQGDKAPKARAARPERSRGTVPATSLVADKGKFRILLDGQPVGSEEFEISQPGRDWQARATTQITTADGKSTQVKGTLRLAADGTPLRYEWSTQGEKKAGATVDFQGGVAQVVLLLENSQPFEQQFTFDSPRIVILDNNLYHHYAILARLYDWSARGAQTFPVLIPQEMIPGSITVESIGAQSIEGKTLELLRVRTPDLEIDLYLDSARRLVQLAVPSSKALILRE
jgi:hypothetical protein